jgi:pimeloyl-ACP methyl ester carboxylesterase
VRTVDVEGLRIAYEKEGSGPPIVLLHGYVGDGPSVWRHQIDALSEDFSVLAWDAPGAGGSDDPPESFGMAGYADCLAAFLAALGVERPSVVGLSFGGALALALADRHPTVPAALVLASAYAGWHGSLPSDVASARLEQALRLSLVSPSEFVDTLLPTMFASAVGANDILAFRRSMEEFHPSGFRALSLAAAADLSDAAARVAVPTLLVYGDRDDRAPLTVAEELRGAIAGSRLVVLDGVGHVCNVEDPERFNDAVRGFLLAAAADRDSRI